jgi:hypothetical protein
VIHYLDIDYLFSCMSGHAWCDDVIHAQGPFAS